MNIEGSARGPSHAPSRWRWAVTAAVSAAAVVASLGLAGPAGAVEAYDRPVGSTLTLAGHGYGHGHGMSQWGAYGAASKGLSWRQITAFYYPGTTVGGYGNPAMRVQLRALGYSDTEVVPRSGTTLSGRTTSGATRTYVLPSSLSGRTIAAWRTDRPSAVSTFVLQRRFSGSSTWTTDGALRNTPYPMTYANRDTAVVRTILPSGTRRDYRGTVTAALSGSSMTSVNRVSLDTYLRSVVPSEMPASWSTAALQSQAVAARTYAAYDAEHSSGGSLYDTCDTTACQVYSGKADYNASGSLVAAHEFSSSTSAVSSTSGSVLTYRGAVAFTQFSASSGGWTSDGGQPYLLARKDPYDGVPSGSPHSWSLTVPISSIQSAFPATGTYRRLEVLGRDGNGDYGGRITRVRVVGSAGSTTVTGPAFRTTLNGVLAAQRRSTLRSEWFVVTSAPAASRPAFPRDLDDDGKGDLLAVDANGRLRLASGTGAGTFASPRVAGGGWSSLTMVRSVGPFDADSRGDVVGRRPDGTLWLYPGSSDGFFRQSPTRIGRGWNAVSPVLAPGDWDGDGHNDLLGRETSTGRLWLYPGSGDGRLLRPRVVGTGWNSMRAIFASGDVTGDGKPDVLALRDSNEVLYVYPGDGRGGWLTKRVVTAGWGGYSDMVGPGDVTGDGRGDVVARRSRDGAMVLYAGTGRGKVRPGVVVLTGWGGYPVVVP